MLVFALSIFCFCLQWVFGYRVLLIGDSIDRGIVEDWCYIDRPKPPSKRLCPDCVYWFEDTGSRWDSSLCSKGNDSIANVHHFGSRDTGPYFSKDNVAPHDFAPNIIHNSISHYFTKIGIPDLILYQAVMWDAAYVKDIYKKSNTSTLEDVTTKYSMEWNKSIEIYKGNMRRRIQNLKDTVQENLARLNVPFHVNIGLRTGVYNVHIGSLGEDFNDVVRQLTREHNITLFDLDNEVWSTYDWDRSKEHLILRDVIHPIPYFNGLAGLKLLGHRYSSNLIFRGPSDVHSSRPHICLGPHLNRRFHCSLDVMQSEPTTEVMLVAAAESRGKRQDSTVLESRWRRRLLPSVSDVSSTTKIILSPVYYLQRDSLQTAPERVGPISSHLRQVLRLSQGDILYLQREDLDRLPLSHWHFPPISSNDSRNSIMNTTNGHLYIYFAATEMFRQYTATIEGLRYFGFTVIPSNVSQMEWECPEIIQNVAENWLIRLFSIGPAIPNIFHERALIRYVASREVYVVLEGTKRLIPNTGVFFQYGSDFSEVEVVVDIDDFNKIPLGPSL